MDYIAFSSNLNIQRYKTFKGVKIILRVCENRIFIKENKKLFAYI